MAGIADNNHAHTIFLRFGDRHLHRTVANDLTHTVMPIDNSGSGCFFNDFKICYRLLDSRDVYKRQRLNTVFPDLMLIEDWEKQAPPLQYGDTVQFQFPKGMPERIECTNDIFLLDKSQKHQGVSSFLYEDTTELPQEIFNVSDGEVTVTLAEPVFVCSEQAVNGLRISCFWPDGSDFCYSLWIRIKE